jgi:hypothetical protein
LLLTGLDLGADVLDAGAAGLVPADAPPAAPAQPRRDGPALESTMAWSEGSRVWSEGSWMAGEGGFGMGSMAVGRGGSDGLLVAISDSLWRISVGDEPMGARQ